MNEGFFKSTDLIPVSWRYRCVVCGLVVEISQQMIDMWNTFFSCPVCQAGEDGGPKTSNEDVREFLGD